MPDRETAHLIRGLTARAVVRATNDNAETQTADVTIWHGVDRRGVEVLHPFGVASRPPAGGPVIVLAVGGDQGDLVALPIGAPGVRLGHLEEGEVAIHVADGSRVHIHADGSIDVASSSRVHATVPGADIDLTPELVRGRIGEGETAPRFVADPDHVKLRHTGDWVVVMPGEIRLSQPAVIAPDPKPEV